MKVLWTSCYQKSGLLPDDLVQVQISRKAPYHWMAKRKGMVWEFAPNDAVWAAYKARPTEDLWRPAYVKQLEFLADSGRLVRLIDWLDDGSVMLCWEANHEECHRLELARFLNGRGLALVREYPADLPKGHVKEGARKVLI